MTTERISHEEFQRRVRAKAGFIDRPSKYGAVKVLDPETGRTVDSKAELRLLSILRAKCRKEGWILCRQAEIQIEGGTHKVDFLLLRPPSFKIGLSYFIEDETKFFFYEGGSFALVEAKGVDHPDGKRRRKQVLERHGLAIGLIHTGRKSRKNKRG